jgi:hypothetical protein
MMRLGSRFILLVAFVVVVVAEETVRPGEEAYFFTLDGKPFTPEIVSLRGDAAHPQPGDLLRIDDLLLTLGPEHACHFVTTPDEDGRLLLQAAGGPQRVVGALVRWHYVDDRKVVYNPLARLPPDEVRRLWGIYLDEWPDGVAEKLKQADASRTCLTLTDNVVQKESGKMPSVPADTQYLCVEERSNSGIRDYQALGALTKLRYLSIRAMTAEALDARLIAQNQSLRYLDLGTRSLQHPEALSQLHQLEWLDLASIRDLATVDYAAKMPQLKYLAVNRTSVRDLSPLAALGRLAHIVASQSPVERLPDQPLPALRTLEVFSTPLSEATVASFGKLNPQCNVLFRWDAAFRQAVQQATRLRIRSGGTCHRDRAAEKTLFELPDAVAIRDFANLIQIDEEGSGFHCLCCGDPSFEFYQEDRLIATLGFHHGRSLRWPGHWPGDGLLTPECGERLPAWFAQHGYDAFQKAREAAIAAKRQEQEKLQAFLDCYPEPARKLFDPHEINEQRAKQIAQVIGDPVQTVLATCRALGTDGGSWSFMDTHQRLAYFIAATASNEEFYKALQQLRGDWRAELGAARLCFDEEPPKELVEIGLSPAGKFSDKIPFADRTECLIGLARTVLDRDSDGNAFAAICEIADLRDEKTKPLLYQIARGELAKAKTAWTAGGQKPGLRGVAYLGLAKLGDASIRRELEKHLADVPPGADRAALEISLALLGHPKYIKAEHFKFDSYVLGYAGVQAIENFRGREGLDVLIEAGADHPYANVRGEACQAIDRITGQAWKWDDDGKALKAWWREHGTEFVKQRRAEK